MIKLMDYFKKLLVHAAYKFQLCIAKRRFDSAAPVREFLPENTVKKIIEKYSKIEASPFQDYSLPGLKKRARERVNQLGRLGSFEGKSVLEIGAADGFVLKECLAEGAKRALAVDVRDQRHEEVKQSGVEIALTSAENMKDLQDHSFDLIYSWGSLEHILEIEKVATECYRLLRPQGFIFIEAGPLYYSPWGYHYYSILRVPYIHLLFPGNVLKEYALARRNDGKNVDFPWTSGNSFSRYKAIIQHLPQSMSLIDFWHGYDWFHSDLIIKYPEIFKSKNVPFDEFFIDCVRIVLTKK